MFAFRANGRTIQLARAVHAGKGRPAFGAHVLAHGLGARFLFCAVPCWPRHASLTTAGSARRRQARHHAHFRALVIL